VTTAVYIGLIEYPGGRSIDQDEWTLLDVPFD